jgi:lysine N6-hydroxylase
MYLRYFQGLSGETRQRYVAEQNLTTDGIAMSTLQQLYQANYEFFLREGRAPVMMLPGRNVVGAANRDGTVILWCERDAGGRERHTARHVVLATGRQPAPLPFTERLTELMDLDERGEPVIEQDYSVRWKHTPEHRIFLQNRGRLSHGVVDPNLSLLSVRSAMILNSLFEREVFTIRDELVNTLWG